MNHELPDVQADFRKGRGTRDQIANIRWIIKKAREFQNEVSLEWEVYGKSTPAPMARAASHQLTSICPLLITNKTTILLVTATENSVKYWIVLCFL